MCGDGGFAMLMQEFLTSVQHGLPVFAKGTTVKNPDFAMFAEATWRSIPWKYRPCRACNWDKP
jgi:hypothetical protein